MKLISNKYLYDGSTGEYFFVGKSIIEAIRQVLNLPWEQQSIRDDLLYNAKQIVKQKIEEGSFSSTPFKGYNIPSDYEINSPKLKVLTLVVTEQCNLRCTYCPYSAGISNKYRKHSSKNMSMDVANMAVDFFLRGAEDGSALGFYGGEPFLNFELIKHVVSRVKKETPLNINFTVTTNLNYFSEEIARFLHENKILMVVSLDGPQQIHDEFRKKVDGRGSFNTVIKNLNFIRENYPDYFSVYVTSNTVITSHINLDSIEYFFSNFAPRFSYSSFTSAKQIDPKNIYSTNEEVEGIRNWIFEKMCSLSGHEQLRECVLLPGLIHKRIMALEKPYVLDKTMLIPFKTCIPGNKILVNVDGSLSICEKCESLQIGHVSTGINFKKTKQLIFDWNELLGNNCLNCWAVGFCKTCYISAWNGKELNTNLLNSYCTSFKRGILKWLEVYLPIKYHNKQYFAWLEELEEI